VGSLVCGVPIEPAHVEEMMQKRDDFVDHSTVHRWAIKRLPVIAAFFRRHKRPLGGGSLRIDEIYIRVGGQWTYLRRSNHHSLT